MGAMVPVVEGPKDWLVVEGPFGGEVVAVDVVGREAANELVAAVEEAFAEEEPHDVFLEGLGIKDYFENYQVYEADIMHGFCACFTMPGYLDRTDNCGPCKTEEDALGELAELYPEDFVPDYDSMTPDEERETVEHLVRDMTPAQVLDIGDVYIMVKEHLNNEVLDAWAMAHPGRVKFVGNGEDGEDEE